jgi:hypothetical protein
VYGVAIDISLSLLYLWYQDRHSFRCLCYACVISLFVLVTFIFFVRLGEKGSLESIFHSSDIKRRSKSGSKKSARYLG